MVNDETVLSRLSRAIARRKISMDPEYTRTLTPERVLADSV